MERRPYISFGLGRSFLIGDSFAGPDDSLTLAKPGLEIMSEASIAFTPFVSFKFSGGGAFNSIDLLAYEKKLRSDLSARNFSGRYEATNGGWYTGYYLFGILFSLPFKKVTLDFDIQAGPTLSIKFPSELTLYHANGVTEKTYKARGIGWDLGAGYGSCLRYTLSKKIALYANTKMLLAEPKMKTKVEHLYNSNLLTSTTEKYKQWLIYWTVGFGIAYQVVR
ncbi:MAG TPA: hypothetical protein VF691_02205 [Cytophagaceae bacterium]